MEITKRDIALLIKNATYSVQFDSRVADSIVLYFIFIYLFISISIIIFFYFIFLNLFIYLFILGGVGGA